MIQESNSQLWFVDQPIAHRGLHGNKVPENSIESFEEAIKNHFPIELDLQVTKDDIVVVHHDESLFRMTGHDELVANLTYEEITKYPLSNGEVIPTLFETLKFVNNRVPLLIEIKSKSFNGKIEKATAKLLAKYMGRFAIQSFNPKTVLWFKNNYPHFTRGLLSGSFDDEDVSLLTKIVLKNLMLFPLLKPDFIAYESVSLTMLNSQLIRRLCSVPLLAWTIRSEKELNVVKSLISNYIFEGFNPNK